MDEKTEKYFNATYPNYEALSPVARKKADLAKQFIEEHLPDLDLMSEGLRLSYREEEPSAETLRDALTKVKANVYTEALHPNYKQGNFLEQKAASTDQKFILANLEEIETLMYTYYAAMKDGVVPEKSPEEIIKEGVEGARELLKGKNSITPAAAEKLSIDSGITSKEMNDKSQELNKESNTLTMDQNQEKTQEDDEKTF